MKPRLKNLEGAIVRADARWFYASGFIGREIYERVVKWLDGGEDKEIQEMVATWMEHDAAWIDEVENKSLAHFWYISPAVWLESVILKRKLTERAKQLKV